MNHSNSGLAHGTSGSPQLTMENLEAEIQSAENEKNNNVSYTLIYKIILSPKNIVNAEKIKVISEIVQCSSVSAEKLFESAPIDIYNGTEIQIERVVKKLEASEILFTVKPLFC